MLCLAVKVIGKASIANKKYWYMKDTAKNYKLFPLNPPVWVGWMTETLCLLPRPTMAIECLCFDQKTCDVHIDDGGNLVCRHGSNEGVVDGIAKVICPLEIDSERIKWEEFLDRERNEKANALKTRTKS